MSFVGLIIIIHANAVMLVLVAKKENTTRTLIDRQAHKQHQHHNEHQKEYKKILARNKFIPI